jgi:AAA15 family ATPase/GTPase
MIKQIQIKNFRSVKNVQIGIKPLTLLYGHNASGKSSILYAPFILRNIVLNPNQAVNGFSNLIFCNFGGFDQVVYKHDPKLQIEVGITSDTEFGELSYTVAFGKEEGKFNIKLEGKIDEILNVKFPYPANSQKKIQIKIEEEVAEFIWNGITASSSTQPLTQFGEKLLKNLNSIVELIKNIDIVPLKRGFSKPVYSPVPVSQFAVNEDQVATLLTGGFGYLKNKVHTYVRKIFKKDFQLTSSPGTSIFYLQTVDERGLTSELVNEGFGVNQTIYLLSKVLRPEASVILIEEPEIHLHPIAQNRLIEAFVEIVENENKTLIISTHSEHIVSSVLSLVAENKMSHQQIACYLCKKEKGRTIIQEQKVNSKGQIEGGLTSFMEAEIKALRRIIGQK